MDQQPRTSRRYVGKRACCFHWYGVATQEPFSPIGHWFYEQCNLFAKPKCITDKIKQMPFCFSVGSPRASCSTVVCDNFNSLHSLCSPRSSHSISADSAIVTGTQSSQITRRTDYEPDTKRKSSKNMKHKPTGKVPPNRRPEAKTLTVTDFPCHEDLNMPQEYDEIPSFTSETATTASLCNMPNSIPTTPSTKPVPSRLTEEYSNVTAVTCRMSDSPASVILTREVPQHRTIFGQMPISPTIAQVFQCVRSQGETQPGVKSHGSIATVSGAVHDPHSAPPPVSNEVAQRKPKRRGRRPSPPLRH